MYVYAQYNACFRKNKPHVNGEFLRAFRFPAGYDLFTSVLPALLTTSDCHLQCVVTKCTAQTKASSVAAVASSRRKTTRAAAGAPLSTTRTSPSAAAARSTASRTHPSVERSRSREHDTKEHLSFLRMTIVAVLSITRGFWFVFSMF